jgi:hypothetical protein
MHLKLDDEIFQVESRIAGRKTALSASGREARRKTLDRLASPTALAAALALGFCIAGRRKRAPEDRRRSAKSSTIVSALMAGALWLVRAQFGSPAGLAQALIQRFSRREPAH